MNIEPTIIYLLTQSVKRHNKLASLQAATTLQTISSGLFIFKDEHLLGETSLLAILIQKKDVTPVSML